MGNNFKSRELHLRRQTSAVELQHLRYAIAAADFGSFRRAADMLMLQQSTISRCVLQLERLIGVTFFERSSGGVRATEPGRDFLRLARSIVGQMDSLVAVAHKTGRGRVGRLSIGFYTSLSAGTFRTILVDFAKRFPEIELDMIEGSRSRLLMALRNSAVDVAIVTGETALSENGWMPLWSERILIVLPESHRLASAKVINWTELKGETLARFA